MNGNSIVCSTAFSGLQQLKNIKVTHNCPLWRESTGAGRRVSKPWCYYGLQTLAPSRYTFANIRGLRSWCVWCKLKNWSRQYIRRRFHTPRALWAPGETDHVNTRSSDGKTTTIMIIKIIIIMIIIIMIIIIMIMNNNVYDNNGNNDDNNDNDDNDNDNNSNGDNNNNNNNDNEMTITMTMIMMMIMIIKIMMMMMIIMIMIISIMITITITIKIIIIIIIIN